MVVAEIYFRMSERTPGLPEDGSNDSVHSGPVIDGLIESVGMDGVILDLDVTTGWTVFQAPTLYDDDVDG